MYVELHAASAFSFLRASSLPEELAERAAELGYPALALLDRDGVSGAPRFFKAARQLWSRSSKASASAVTFALGSAFSAFIAAPVPRPPHPIRPTFNTSSPAAWALRAMDRLPAAAARLVAFRKLRRVVRAEPFKGKSCNMVGSKWGTDVGEDSRRMGTKDAILSQPLQ